MNVMEYGANNRQVIVLLHGGGLSWWNYRAAAQLLARRFHVVLPVLDGHGGGKVPFVSIEESARQMLAYVDTRFNGHICLLGGLSLGGQVAAEMLSQRQGICDFAVLESVCAVPRKWLAALVPPVFELSFPLVSKRWFAKLQFWALHLESGLFADYQRDTARIEKDDLIAFTKASVQYAPKAGLSDCDAKTLVLVGRREQPLMKRSAERLAGLIPNARLQELCGLRHGELSCNRAEKYSELLEELIDS